MFVFCFLLGIPPSFGGSVRLDTFPIPTTARSGNSFTAVAFVPILSSVLLSGPCGGSPPPIVVVPLSLVSTTGSKNIFSDAAYTMAAVYSARSSGTSGVSRRSASVTWNGPMVGFLPIALVIFSSSLLCTRPVSVFVFSTILSPVEELYYFFVCLAVTSSGLSPPVFVSSLAATPPESVATASTIPPPVSVAVFP